MESIIYSQNSSLVHSFLCHGRSPHFDSSGYLPVPCLSKFRVEKNRRTESGVREGGSRYELYDTNAMTFMTVSYNLLDAPACKYALKCC